MTGAAEAQAKTGHDMYTFFNWDVHNVADALEPIDDVMQQLVAKNGAVNETCGYLAKVKGHWVAVPTSSGTQTKPPCARISWFKKHGLDLQAMYPVKAEHNALQDAWTWDAFLKYAEMADKDGMTFALGMGGGTNTDATDTTAHCSRHLAPYWSMATATSSSSPTRCARCWSMPRSWSNSIRRMR